MLIGIGVSSPEHWYGASLVFAPQISLVQFTRRPKPHEPDEQMSNVVYTLRSVCSVFVGFMRYQDYPVSDSKFNLKVKCVDKAMGMVQRRNTKWKESEQTETKLNLLTEASF